MRAKMNAAFNAIRFLAFGWALPSVSLHWTDIAFIVGLTYFYGRILHWMERDDEFVHIDEILTRVYLVYLMMFCCFAWVWRGILAEIGLDAAPYLKYGILLIPAMGHDFITKWVTLDRLDRPDEAVEPFKVQYAVSMIFVVFCWAYLAHLE
ncbi:hypothetical protein BKA65DRAFT_223521 [Rhexocercosporidium sp. MPI-PUGE-AT-0058]|nr:hypothetical protein BKA65DRAFT_223521 [Rhexocercosporidium sp. MPI-PUGE-AT-0058]